MELPTQPHEVESARFAHEIAALLNRGLTDSAYERLILIAPPHFLGLLRVAISDDVAKRVELDLDKDYTAFDARELAERLEI
jgi:protein required for attachment to host cells